MADLQSPGVQVREIDLTTVIPGASSTIAGYAGVFNWGPIGTPVLVSDEDELGLLMGQPKASFSTTASDANLVATSFMTASSYLAYSDGLRVSRVANINDATPTDNAINAVATLTVGDSATPILIKNSDDYVEKDALGSLGTNFVIAKYAGTYGNSVGVSAVFTAKQFSSTELLSTEVFTLTKSTKTLTFAPASTEDLTEHFSVGDVVYFEFGGVEYKNTVKTVSALALTLVDIGAQMPTFASGAQTGTVDNIRKGWKFAGAFNGAPSTNEFHLVVYDATGLITGAQGTVLELFPYLSTSIGAKNADGTTAYYKSVINDQSAYIWVGGATITGEFASTSSLNFDEALSGGRNGTEPSIDDYLAGYDVFKDKDNVNIDILISSPAMGDIANAVLPSYLVQNIAEVRKDVVVYLSPRYSDVVNKPNQERKNVLEYRATLPSSSYAFMDSGWKYMYDKYNNTFRWVPLCGDTAGTAARTDDERDSWWSHAGFNRGIIKNAFKLAWNPDNTNRDDLYQKGVNPVVTVGGIGSVLYGDKTMLDRPSAFDRINVRRLFIVLEKAIANASKYSLFEFNDEFTRSRFVSLVEPFLRDVQSRRGISAFKVVCDSTNNTAQVIDTNRFIGDIYIKPNRSINYITLNFVAVPTGVSFEEVVGSI